MPESFLGCQRGEALRTLLAQSGHPMSIRKSGSVLCYPSVKKVTKQLSINYFRRKANCLCLGQLHCTPESVFQKVMFQ